MANLMIVRGLPGAGKSTFVKNNYPGLFYLETDMMNIVDGKYIWTVERATDAITTINRMCDAIWRKTYEMDFALVGVFGNPLHFYYHVIDALKNGYNVYIKTLKTQFKSIHNLPEESFNKMKENFMDDEEVKNYLKKFVDSNLLRIHFEEMPKII